MTDPIATEAFADVTVSLDGQQVAEVEMHRPPANFFDTALLVGVVEAVDWAAAHRARARSSSAPRGATSAPDSTSVLPDAPNPRRWPASTPPPPG